MNPNDTSGWFFNVIIGLFNEGKTDMFLDYETKDGEKRKLRITITEVENNEPNTSKTE